jgi:segregation and condensation protein B
LLLWAAPNWEGKMSESQVKPEADLHRKLAEAALFMAGRAMTVKELLRAVPGLTPARARNALEDLVSSTGELGALEVVKTSEDGYKMKVKDEFLSQVRRLSNFTDISDGETKTLAVVAFYQPIKQSEIVKIRGNRAYEQIKNLVGAGLIVAEPRGVTKILSTTDRFKDYFGEPLSALRDKLDPRDKAIIDGEVSRVSEEVKAEEKGGEKADAEFEGDGEEEGESEE